MSLYRDHWATIYAVYDVAKVFFDGMSDKDHPKVSDLYVSERTEAAKLDYDTAKKQVKGKVVAQKVHPLRALDICKYQFKKDITTHTRAVALRSLRHNQVQLIFLVRIQLASMLLYGRSHNMMYYRARHGDVESLCDLLRLDKHVTLDPRIGQQVMRAQAQPLSGDNPRILRAFRGRIRKPRSRQVKANFAALAKIMLEEKGIPASFPQIQEAISLAATTDGVPYDKDFIITPDDFRRYINRAKPLWARWHQDKIF